MDPTSWHTTFADAGAASQRRHPKTQDESIGLGGTRRVGRCCRGHGRDDYWRFSSASALRTAPPRPSSGRCGKRSAVLRNIAEGEGDLTRRVNQSTGDELGEMGRWFNTVHREARRADRPGREEHAGGGRARRRTSSPSVTRWASAPRKRRCRPTWSRRRRSR